MQGVHACEISQFPDILPSFEKDRTYYMYLRYT